MDLLDGYTSSSSSSQADDDNNESHNNTTSSHQTKPKNPKNTTNQRPITTKIADRRYLQAAPTPSILATSSLQRKRAAAAASPSPSPSTTTLTTNTTNPPLLPTHKNALLMNNPLKSTLLEPTLGPSASSDPTSRSSAQGLSNGQLGSLQSNVTFDHYTFEEQRKAFQRSGTAIGPDEKGTMVERGTYGHERRRFDPETGVVSIIPTPPSFKRMRTDHNHDHDDNNNNNNNTKEPLVEGEDDDITYGIWGPPTTTTLSIEDDRLTDFQRNGGIESNLPPSIIAERAHLRERDRQRNPDTAAPAPSADSSDPTRQDESRENRNFDRMVERKMAHLLPPRLDGEDTEAMCMANPTSTFHRSEEEEFDYRGRSWTSPPAGMREGRDEGDVDHHRCYVPKKCVGRLTGHTKGVHRIRLFPKTGHLLLSAGLDGTCRVWSVATKRLMRSYVGHSAAVRDVQFNNDGSKFLSASFDRFVRLWDTESGKVLGTYSNRRVPYVVKFYPRDDSVFVVGCSDNKIVAYDTGTGKITQEYNHHLAPVNTITFVDEGGGGGLKMVTSSDDKKVLVWEWDIGVPIKYISDPTMHSMPVVTMHPSGGFIACQSLDNRIVVYQGHGKFSLQRKKKFVGHQVAGYACDLAISPDGKFICSGDGHGKLCFWDWRMHKMLQKYRAHDKGPAIGCVWHPVLPSTVFTCGWDGVIKMWQ